MRIDGIICDAATLDENFKPRYCDRSHFVHINIASCGCMCSVYMAGDEIHWLSSMGAETVADEIKGR